MEREGKRVEAAKLAQKITEDYKDKIFWNKRNFDER